MTFTQAYDALEGKFREQVDSDNRDLDIVSGYVPNFIPNGPVDYVLIAMEPSTGVPGKAVKGPCQVERNFSWSVEDFILHHCIRKWLCRSHRTYHLTDLAKGGMKTEDARKTQTCRYERWYPLLKEELRLLNKQSGTRVIAIGKVVGDFLEGKDLCEKVVRVLHYSRNAAPHRSKKIRDWTEQFATFSRSFDNDALDETIEQVLADADMSAYASVRPEGGKDYKLTESRKKLMFHYKEKFSKLRDAPHIVLNEI